MTTPRIDLQADLNAEDDEGRNWSLMRNALVPAAIVPGALVVAGYEGFWPVVRIDEVDEDGQVHFVPIDHEDPAARAVLEAPGAEGWGG